MSEQLEPSTFWLCCFSLHHRHAVSCQAAAAPQQPQAHRLTEPLCLYYIGNCKITVDVTCGYVAADEAYGCRNKPTTMRTLAEHVITQCLWSDTGNGGFITLGLGSAILAKTSVTPNVGIFMVVTVSSPAVTANPGKTDPAVVQRVMERNDGLRSTAQDARAAEMYRLINLDLAQRRAQMTPGGTTSWIASEVSSLIPLF